MKIKAAKTYVLGVKKARLLCLGVLLSLLSFVLLTNGLALIQSAFFTYSMWSNEVKFIVALLLGGVEFFGAVGVLIYLFREETWSRFTEIQKVVDSALNEEAENKESF